MYVTVLSIVPVHAKPIIDNSTMTLVVASDDPISNRFIALCVILCLQNIHHNFYRTFNSRFNCYYYLPFDVFLDHK